MSKAASCACWPPTAASAPSAGPPLDELGYKTVSDSPFGVCGPKGMDPTVVRTLHDAFKKTLEDPAVLASFDKFDQTVIYMDTEQYTRFARESFAAEKATIERLGMAKPG
jgi:tripartite-type tricarboxylate transporter receptor subunit TctC